MSEPKLIEATNEEMIAKHLLVDTALAEKILKLCDGAGVPEIVATLTSLTGWMIEKHSNNPEGALHETIAYLLWYVDLPETSEGETLQ